MTASSIVVAGIDADLDFADRENFRRRMRLVAPPDGRLLGRRLAYPSIIGVLPVRLSDLCRVAVSLLLLPRYRTRAAVQQTGGWPARSEPAVGFGAVLTGANWLLGAWFGCVGCWAFATWLSGWAKERIPAWDVIL